MKNKVINALISMGMAANLKGFRYIADAVCLLEDSLWRDAKITDLYKKIAGINDTTSSRVERAIRHAFETVLGTGNQDFIDKYLSRTNTTNGNFLHTFYLRLTQEE